ncbi:right-handed parallel beta-helix repeat-containing protein, partial [Candidatus Pacearchaeota archaeon]|nr:right-handed parallel beta-helix repeat-containing protein [Candidatus Pacearchaeota archaeon]
MRAGIYTGTLSPANSGTAGNLITFKAYPGDECVQASDYNVRPVCMVKLSSTVNFNLKSFVRVEGFEISNGGGSGFYCQDRDQEVVKGVEMVNNYIHDMDDYGIDCRNVHDALIENNYIHDVPGSAGIGLRGDRVATNVTIRGNKILRITCDGMDIQGKNIIIENNVLGDSFRSGCHPDAFEITEPVNGLIIRNNRIFDFTQYIYGGPNDGTPSSVFENVYIYGNVLYNDKYWQENGGEAPGIFLASPQSSPTVVRNLYIHSNTFGWLGYPAIRLLAGGGRAPMDNVVIHNNIFYQSGIDIAPAVTNVNSNYNLFYTKPSAPSGPNDDTATPYPSEGPNSIIGQDPQFVNYDFFNNFDFRLKSASPAIDKGDPNLAVLFTLPLPFKDTDGTSRPQGSALDMGAYEFPQIVSCNTNADCNNGLFCDGQEVCSGGLCSDGADPCIADSYSCTTTCDEATDSCNVLNNAACNDNNACTINDRCVGATGDSITGCAYDFAASGTSCTISGAQCASAQQCNGAGTCTATANVALCTNPNNCASVSCNANN